jgi:hypothetical protein
MNTHILPELAARLSVSAAELAGSSNDSIIVEGADNKILVKASSALGKENIDANMVLFPYQFGGEEYLVCIHQKVLS